MVNPKIGILIQARINSNRLPGKVLLSLPQIYGQTLLDQIVRRSLAVQPQSTVIIATSTNSENDQLAAVAEQNQVALFQGDEDDVLARFYDAATAFNLDIIIRLTADNPFIDASILSRILQEHIAQQADYTYTTGLPIGTNIEIVTFMALKKCYEEAKRPEHREHVTLYIRQNPTAFNILHRDLENPLYGLPTWRLTVDNETDYALACALYLLLDNRPDIFSLQDVAQLLHANPALLLINKNNYQKKYFSSLPEELTEAVQMLQRLDFPRAAQILAEQIS